MSVIQNVESIKYRFLSKEPYSTNDISFVYINSNGEYRLVENGAHLTNAELRAQKYNVRYSILRKKQTFTDQVKLASDNMIDEFEVTLRFTVKVIEPIEYIKNDMDEQLESNVKDRVFGDLRRMANQYAIEEYVQLESTMKGNLQVLDELEDEGLKVDIIPQVEVSQEIKQKLKSKRDAIDDKRLSYTLEDMDKDRERQLREKEFAEFTEIFAGTPLERYTTMFKNVDQLREHLLSEYKDKRNVMEKLKTQYMDGQIDATQLKKAQDLFQGFDSMIGGVDSSQLESGEKKLYIERSDSDKDQSSKEETENSFSKGYKKMATAEMTDKGWE
ncbi:hypothetical protein LGQ02_19315 [Bacillus shivajii]|uniref:hypothetical protein n=1 Tax=Bacillus shivajii TaxID=1983719 RepID=UPI001CFA0861|nr:hypothetical protein [Bacillus shivajii]UCZ52904.1 hypothetical protein LGQ02_19315 [Bacillus shivajii]